jgi:hypothetical protein
MEIKLSSGDTMSQPHYRMVKHFTTDAEMAKLLPLRCWNFSVTIFMAME